MRGDAVAEQPEDIGLEERARLQDRGWPKMAFIRRKMADDPTNWWLPNHACVEAMLNDVGFEISARPGDEIYLCQRNLQLQQASLRDTRELHAAVGPRHQVIERAPQSDEKLN